MVTEGQHYDFQSARALVRAFHGPMLRDEVLSVQLGEAMPVRALFASKREILKLHLPGELLFIFRIRFGVMSVLPRELVPPRAPARRGRARTGWRLSRTALRGPGSWSHRS